MSHNSLTTLHGELSSLPNLRVTQTLTLTQKHGNIVTICIRGRNPSLVLLYYNYVFLSLIIVIQTMVTFWKNNEMPAKILV